MSCKMRLRGGFASRAALVCLLGLILIGCRRKPKQIALITTTTGVAIWDASHAGAVAGASSCGLGLHYDAPPREDDLQGQLALFNRALPDAFAGVILAPIQAQALRNPVQRALSAGLPIVIIGEDLGLRRSNLAYVLTDERQGGEIAARKVGELLKGKGHVAVMGLDLNRASSLQREQGFEAELTRSFPGIHVVGRRSGSANLAQEQQTAQEVLSLPDGVDALVALSAASTRGAYFAKLNQEHPATLHIVGFDQDLITPVRSGEIDAVVASRARDIGRIAAGLICTATQGGAMQAATVVNPLLVTPANLDGPEVAPQFLERSWWDQVEE